MGFNSHLQVLVTDGGFDKHGRFVHQKIIPFKAMRKTNKQRIARYVARYIRHPAVANTRLHRYDGKAVTFWYEDREGKRHFVTMDVREFIKALIQHIPDRNFKVICIMVLTAVELKENIPDTYREV
jgi:hypothetical protein